MDGPNAIKNWTNHYMQHQPTKEFLILINKKLCGNNICNVVINKNKTLLAKHVTRGFV